MTDNNAGKASKADIELAREIVFNSKPENWEHLPELHNHRSMMRLSVAGINRELMAGFAALITQNNWFGNAMTVNLNNPGVTVIEVDESDYNRDILPKINIVR